MDVTKVRCGLVAVILTAVGGLVAADKAPPLPPNFTLSPAAPAGTPPPAPAPVKPVARPGSFGNPIQINPSTAPAVTVPATAWTPPPPLNEIVFDSLLKEVTGKTGDSNVVFNFSLTNISPNEVFIQNVRTSCGCTVANVPAKPGQPWRLPPGTNTEFGVTVDVRGKFGTLLKSVFVDATVGTNTQTLTKTLTVRVNLPNQAAMASSMGDREKNMTMAMADRQTVFRNDCARCHAEPAVGKMGMELYKAVCANCHDSEHRASMVPDLRSLKHPTNEEHWRKWITSGRVGSLMPAFAKAEGGPLSDDQINSLVQFLVKAIPSAPATATANAAVEVGRKPDPK